MSAPPLSVLSRAQVTCMLNPLPSVVLTAAPSLPEAVSLQEQNSSFSLACPELFFLLKEPVQ